MVEIHDTYVVDDVFCVSAHAPHQLIPSQQIAESIALYQQRLEAMFALEEALSGFTARYYTALQAPLAQLSRLKHQLASAQAVSPSAVKASAAPSFATSEKRAAPPTSAQLSRTPPAHPVNGEPAEQTQPLFDARAIPQKTQRAQSLLKQRYHYVCRLAHPDAHQGDGVAARRKAHEWMQAANAAYVQRNAAVLWRVHFEMEEVAAAGLSAEAREVAQQERVSMIKRHAYDMGEWLAQLEESDEAKMMRLAQEMAQLGTPMEEVVATQLAMEIETTRRALAKAQLAAMAHLRSQMS